VNILPRGQISPLGAKFTPGAQVEEEISKNIKDPWFVLQPGQPLKLELCNKNSLLFRQIIGLAKIAAFCKDQSLAELRQKEIRNQCLYFWKIPDQVRRAPMMYWPQVSGPLVFFHSFLNSVLCVLIINGLRGGFLKNGVEA
jgi:hypothetical protein